MKKVVIILFAVVLVIGLSGCVLDPDSTDLNSSTDSAVSELTSGGGSFSVSSEKNDSSTSTSSEKPESSSSSTSSEKTEGSSSSTSSEKPESSSSSTSSEKTESSSSSTTSEKTESSSSSTTSEKPESSSSSTSSEKTESSSSSTTSEKPESSSSSTTSEKTESSSSSTSSERPESSSSSTKKESVVSDPKPTSSSSSDEDIPYEPAVTETTGIELISMTNPLRRNEDAQVTIKGLPNTEYRINVYYSSGRSTAEGLENKISDSEGYVTWTWHVGGRTKLGDNKKVEIEGGGQTLKTTFSVVN